MKRKLRLMPLFISYTLSYIVLVLSLLGVYYASHGLSVWCAAIACAASVRIYDEREKFAALIVSLSNRQYQSETIITIDFQDRGE